MRGKGMHAVCHFEIQADDPVTLIRFCGEVSGWQFDRAEGLPTP